MISKARLKFLRSLRLKKARASEGLLLVEGLNAVEEAVSSGHALELLLTDEAASGPRGRGLEKSDLPRSRIGERESTQLALTRTPAGAFALAKVPCGPFEAGALPESAVVLFAAGVADPGNLGTLIRTAAALGASAVVVAPGSVEPTNPKVVRATAGALFRLPVLSGGAEDLKAAGFQILVADAHGTPVGTLEQRAARLALAVGSEPHGVDGATRGQADGSIAVPLTAGMESLNVSVAAGILLHALCALPVRDRR
ncbi:MAG: TrmH family RNA methyltransferase [Planctomycetota bacterium]